MKPQRLITLFLLGTLLTVGANTTFNEGTVLATYMDSYANGPKPGWRFLWNENGEIDEPAGYVPLILLPGPERRTWMNYYVNKDNTVRMGLSCFVPGCPEGQTRRHAIAAYTLSSDIDGDI